MSATAAKLSYAAVVSNLEQNERLLHAATDIIMGLALDARASKMMDAANLATIQGWQVEANAAYYAGFAATMDAAGWREAEFWAEVACRRAAGEPV